MHRLSEYKKMSPFIDGIMFFTGCLLFAISVHMFTAPNNLAPGGFIGLATIFARMLNNDAYIWPINIIINIPVFIWAWKEAGFNFIIKSLIPTVLSSVIGPLISFLPKYTSVSNGGIVPDGDFDMMLVSILGGFIGGLGIALVFMRGGTTGGIDIVASIISRKARHISIGKFLFMLDFVIILSSIFVYKNIESPIYATIVVFVTTKVMDTVLYGISIGRGKMMFIVSPKNKQIAKKIINDIGRGVTELKSRGSYSGREGEVLLCAVRRPDVYKIYALIHSIDEKAFIVVAEAGEISGEGFRDLQENV
jgi:uncharacterized membrane-anchored protein YitT (DUF2179 family)